MHAVLRYLMHTPIVLLGLLSTADNLVWGYYLNLEVIIKGYNLDNNNLID